MRKTFIIIFLLLSASLYAQTMEMVLFDHQQRVAENPVVRLNFYEKLIATGLREFGKGSLNEQLVNYLARHEHLILKFKNSVSFANKNSKTLCQVQERHVDDEVDALRHLLLSGFLSLTMGEEHAFILTSLQEVRGGNNQLSMQMDVWNNFKAIELVAHHKEFLQQMSRTRQLDWMKAKYLELLESGEVKVLQSKPSSCQQSNIYPNL
ncbi:MAG: hypothetical protein CME62_07915 [Halobacteriovoraceae bacterium]|nr:hypothetical protein [Halobacteriovoraceae bacterium]|tara:strand:+ start:1207 stop:1830 length:624 start_codon:yes stop_codon:yes gene_type:complete